MSNSVREFRSMIEDDYRPMDVKITASGPVKTVPINAVPELQKYFDALKA